MTVAHGGQHIYTYIAFVLNYMYCICNQMLHRAAALAGIPKKKKRYSDFSTFFICAIVKQ